MKHWLFVISAGMLAACSIDNPEKVSDKHLVSEEVFKTKIGNKEVYGVRLLLTAPEPIDGIEYRVQLSRNESVWIDTIQDIEIEKDDTVETEVIFSEAIAEQNDKVEIQTKRLDRK